MQIERIDGVRCSLGEGPVWDVAEQALYFTDMIEGRLCRYDRATGAIREWRTPGQIGSFALREGGGAVLALGAGFHLFDFETGAAASIADPEAGDPEVQFNDGKADPRGRFLAGTIHRAGKSPRGAIWRLDADRTVTRIGDDITFSNGPCWSPDGSTFYFADSLPGRIYAYDYDLATGALANRRLFADTLPLGGNPDGATVDADGRLWSALCGVGKLVCWRPDGVVDQVVETPVAMPSSVMFGGPELDELYVTSIDGASVGRESEPGAGDLFVITGLGVKGKPEPRFAG